MNSSTVERLGIQLPSVALLPPASEASVSALGAEAVEFAALAGLDLDPWQAWVLERSMAERAPDEWAAFMVGIIVARQNGKGAILEARELAGLFMVQESLILHSAHEFKTTYEHFLRITNLIEGCPELERQVQKIRRGAGEQAIELRNGNRLRFIARTGGSGRGMSAPCVILDECMYLTDAMVGAIMPTLSAQDNPQLWLTGSAPLMSSRPIHRLRAAAIKGDSDRTFYAEWGNEPGVDPHDMDAIARANPAIGTRLWWDFIDTEREAMSPDEFARERLGVPDIPAEGAMSVIPNWSALADPAAEIVSHEAWAIAVSPIEQGPQWASIGKAGRTADGRLCVGWVAHEPGTAWLVPRCVSLFKAKPMPLRVHKSGPEAALIKSLREAGVTVEEVSGPDAAQATGDLIGLANADPPGLVHLGQASLDKALRGAQLRSSSDGAAVWSQRSSSVEITPLIACTIAAGGVAVESGPSWLFV